jgi:hypothetical protein
VSRRAQALLLFLALLYAGAQAATTSAFDFRAFYCAGTAVAHGADPYVTASLHACELHKTDAAYQAFSRAVTLPAPLPGYDFWMFVPLSRLPFAVAKAIWTLALCVAVAVAVLALVRLTGVSTWCAFAVFWLALIVPSLEYGEVIPIAVASIAGAAYLAQSGKWTAAGLAAAASLCEPHLGVPVCLALLVSAPRTRVPILLSGIALASLSLAAIGPARNVEYFQTVLPLHALSELASDAQLSLSVVLHYAGFSDRAAVAYGTVWYFAMAFCAVALSRPLAARFADAGFLVTVPAAFALVGGSFIHVTDMPAAIPLALLAYRYLPQYRAACIVATVLLALPWWHLALLLHQGMYAIVPMTAAVALYVAWNLGRRVMPALALGLLASVALFGINQWYVETSDAYHRISPPVRVTIDKRYPQASWAWTNARFISTGLPASWVLRAPTWCGLLIVSVGGALVLVRKPQHAGGTA